MATVTCTQKCYFYINGIQKSTATYTKTLTAGLTFTPSHANHMPSYDEDVYTEYTITYNNTDYTTGSLTCPSSNFTITYKFYGYQYVTCTQKCYFYINGTQKSSTNYTKSLMVGLAFTPSHANHMPDYDTSTYTSYIITYNGTDYTTGALTCPSSDFTVTYKFYGYTLTSWSWSASNGSASASVTKAAYTAITNKGSTAAFSYLVWNDMVDKVLEALSVAGDSWSTNGSKYLSAASTKMSSSDKTLTAARFNSLRYNIGLRYSTGITDKSKGDTVYGSYFTTLTSALNSWIATLT